MIIANRRKQGFTIVELLIVIVVIAILAAISIVAYNGIQTRAENSKTLAGIDQVAKALQVYKLQNGNYPFTGTGGGMAYACIAENATTCGMVGSTGGTEVTECQGVGLVHGLTTFNDALKTVTSKMPVVSDQTMQCESKTVKGASYFVWGGTNYDAYLIYFLKGDQPCTAPGGSSLLSGLSGRQYFTSGTTRCSILFKA